MLVCLSGCLSLCRLSVCVVFFLLLSLLLLLLVAAAAVVIVVVVVVVVVGGVQAHEKNMPNLAQTQRTTTTQQDT